jgi:hypothetical protein
VQAKRALVAAVAAVALTGAGAAHSAANGVVRCHVRADFNILISSARNMTCRSAATEMRRYRGSISRRFTTPSRFRCYQVSGNRLAGQWRCVRGVRAFRFEFSD